MINNIIISPYENGSRLDRVIKRHYPWLTQGLLEKFLRKGLIKLDQQRIKSNQRVTTGQEISFNEAALETYSSPPPPPLKRTEPKIDHNLLSTLQNNILYKDEHIIVINKPQGVAVQGGSKINISVDDLLPYLCDDIAERPKLVHRLDKDTSGLLLLARNSLAAAELAKAFRNKTISKIYLAVVIGKPKAKHGRIVTTIQEAEDNDEKTTNTNLGKKAITEYRVIDSIASEISLLELSPITGRKHQLRIHCQELGTPILGDKKYHGIDPRYKEANKKLHLHAFRIILSNFMGKNHEFTAPIPQPIKESCKFFGLDYNHIT